MSTRTQPESAPLADTDGADALHPPSADGATDANATVPLPGAKEPHERDESPDSQVEGRGATAPDRADIAQASADVQNGLLDTDRRGVPDDIPHQEQIDGTRPPTRRP